MAYVDMKSDHSMNEDDIAQMLLVKYEIAKNDEIDVPITRKNHPSYGHNNSVGELGGNDNNPILQHIVSVTGCSLTFKIEITGLAYVLDSKIEPYVNINKGDALNWLGSLGYKHGNILGMNGKSDLCGDSSSNNCIVVSNDVQTNIGTTGDIGNHQQEVHNPIKLERFENTKIKQEQNCDDEIDSEDKSKQGIAQSGSPSQQSVDKIEYDKYIFTKTKLEKDGSEGTVSDSELTDQSDDDTIVYESYASDVSGDVVAMDTEPTPGNGVESQPDNTHEQQPDVATETNHKIGKDSDDMEENGSNKPVTTSKTHTNRTSKRKRDSSDQTQNMKQFQCELCNYKTSSATTFALHNKQHENGGKLACELCDYNTAHLLNYKQHIRRHTQREQGKLNKCPMCDYSSVYPSTLRRHTKTHTNPKPKPFKCTYPSCSYSCANASKLKVHEVKHTGELIHKCTMCPYAAKTKGLLKSHMRTHTKERPYKCTLCPYAASVANALYAHMCSSHTKEKPYCCNYCDYSCAHRSSICKHLKRQHKSKLTQ